MRKKENITTESAHENDESEGKDDQDVQATPVIPEEKAPRRLQFITDVLDSLKLTKVSVGRLTSVSQQLICYWLKADDTSYKNVLSLFDQLNYNIKCELTPKEKPKAVKIENPVYSVSINRLQTYTNVKPMAPDSPMTEIYENNGNLKFLAEYAVKNKLTLLDYANFLGVNYYTMYYWFKKDDTKISNIYYVAEKLNMNVLWELTCKE